MNPHMWIPYNGPELWDEVCNLCGAFSRGHNRRPDPEAARLPCPEQWPTSEGFTPEEMAEMGDVPHPDFPVGWRPHSVMVQKS
jgi:hypothetical protein